MSRPSPFDGTAEYRCGRARVVGFWNCECDECKNRAALSAVAAPKPASDVGATPLQQKGVTALALLMRDICELEPPADPDAPNAVHVYVNQLQEVLARHLATVKLAMSGIAEVDDGVPDLATHLTQLVNAFPDRDTLLLGKHTIERIIAAITGSERAPPARLSLCSSGREGGTFWAPPQGYVGASAGEHRSTSMADHPDPSQVFPVPESSEAQAASGLEPGPSMPGSAKPVHEGRYLRYFDDVDDWAWSEWKGREWTRDGFFASDVQDAPWRGGVAIVVSAIEGDRVDG